MAQLYFDRRQIIAKILYVGAQGAGSNTNVRALHGLVMARRKGELLNFGLLDEEHCFLFEHSAPDTAVPGFDVLFRIYSLPGGVESAIQREEAVRDVDAIALVLDARPDRAHANKAALEELANRLRGHGRTLGQIPLVVQVNHTDHPASRSKEAVVADVGMPAPVVPSVANSSQGVAEAHGLLCTELAHRVRQNLSGRLDALVLTLAHGDPPSDEDLIARHNGAIDEAAVPSGAFLGQGAADLRLGLARRYGALPVGQSIEIPFQPRDMVGMRPVFVLGTELDADLIQIEIVMERLSGGEPKRLTLSLANRPPDAIPVSRQATKPPDAVTADHVTRDLPEKVDLQPTTADFPPVWYGVAGLAAGILAGVLVGFLVFA